jgi:hypothetical protein
MDDKVAAISKADKIPIIFQLGDVMIDGAVIRPMSFQNLADYITEASGMKVPTTFEARLRRLRLARQISYFTAGTVVPVSIDDVPKMPVPTARILIARLDADEGTAGKILRDGDGIDSAVLYQLGTPIPTGQGKPPITELEFLASNYGQLEDIMAATGTIAQTAALIAGIAKPLPGTLTQLPSWALNLISVADGVSISQLVTPRFMGSPAE